MTDFASLSRDVREALLRRPLGPAARARLQHGGFAREEEQALAAAAEIIWAWERCDDSPGWAAALSRAAERYCLALMAVEAAAKAMDAVATARRHIGTHQPLA